jgi:cytochrome oxidase Cu insertion factor (SCO1/SenC/PrrC family)
MTPMSPQARAKGRRTLLLLAAVAVAPIIASYSAYYLFPREQRTNYGELLATVPAPPLAGTRMDGEAFALAQVRGKWVLVVGATGACDAMCTQSLHATRQARTIQGREMERVQRVWLITDDVAPDPALLAQHPDLLVARVPREGLAGLPAGPERIYVIDPLGNLVLALPADPDIKRAAKDVERLLRASRIG